MNLRIGRMQTQVHLLKGLSTSTPTFIALHESKFPTIESVNCSCVGKKHAFVATRNKSVCGCIGPGFIQNAKRNHYCALAGCSHEKYRNIILVRLGDRFREHLRDVEKNDKDASKPVARHFNLPNHFKQHMSICGLSLHQGTTNSRKNLEQRFIFQIGTLNPHGINERFSIN